MNRIVCAVSANNLTRFLFTGGCALYGHSCYGGHGKRSEMPRGELMPMESGPLPMEKLFQNNKELVVIK